jgi:acyl-CoA thioester hydrolase
MKTKGTHSFPVRIYYEDTDAGGVVYHANYLKFAERARTEALRLAGIDQSDLREDHKVAFAVRHLEIDYIKPAMLDDLLTIETTIHEIGKVSVTMQQTIRRGDVTLTSLKVKLAVVGAGMKLAPLPEFVKKAMSKIFNLHSGNTNVQRN